MAALQSSARAAVTEWNAHDRAPRVALFVEDGFDDAQILDTRARLQAAGAHAVLIGPASGRTYTGRQGGTVVADLEARRAKASDFDALVIPGGYAPDRMRVRHAMVDFAREAMSHGRPVGVIGHGAQVLISANVLRGRTLTCAAAIAVDVKNAGGLYCDRPVVQDGALVTSRKADDVPAFVAALLAAIAAGAR
jgi:protease I